MAVALGGLTLWHAILISRGETSVERHINRKETKRLRERGKVRAVVDAGFWDTLFALLRLKFIVENGC